ncbi:MAG: ABC transporter, permease protein [Candidatus Moranbacteria bacterium GW2011_GWF2_44_10]|nr:MAG: ABC transporter, permease protein [Candidatus Moranbacteria bacterium GW2011_GWF2_44_10]
MIQDLFRETIRSLSGNKARSGLTILGIVIGIASVITMVAIGQGAKSTIESDIESIGSNLIVVMPGAQRVGGISQGAGSSQTLVIEDADAIKSQVQNVKAVAPEASKRYQITAKGTNTNAEVVGTVKDYLVVRNVKMNIGSFFSDQQQKTSAKVAILGPTTRNDLFGVNANPVGQSVKIRNVDFQVVGVTESKGGSGFNNPDSNIFVPLSSAQHFLSGNDYLSDIGVAAADQASMTSVQEQISALLLDRHKISDPTQADFRIMNQNDIIATATSITSTFTILLSSIAGISLLVGGIGIMNMMLTNVTERTREIGLRKAVGLRKKYINLQFQAEAVVLTFLGGAIGIVLGWGASLLVNNFVSLNTRISLSSVFYAFGVSAVVGIVFGFYPARRAANLNPIEALRYE